MKTRTKNILTAISIILISGQILSQELKGTSQRESHYQGTLGKLHCNFDKLLSVDSVPIIEKSSDETVSNDLPPIETWDIIRIPVVFHILHNPLSQEQNVTDAQILSALEVLNDDFRRRNPIVVNTAVKHLKVTADSKIEFVLANVDQNCVPTTGIVRTAINVDSLILVPLTSTTNDFSVLTNWSPAWPSSNYLNVYICPLFTQENNGNFPLLGAASGVEQIFRSNRDIVAVDFSAIGRAPVNPLDSGGIAHTLTHEIGHWLNLFHLNHFPGEGFSFILDFRRCRDDRVHDTPRQNNRVRVCDTSERGCGHKLMVSNFMQPIINGCADLFTVGQATRMRAVFGQNGFRKDLLNSTGYTFAPIIFSISSPISGTASLTFSVLAQAGNPSFYTLFYRPLGSANWSSHISTLQYASISGLNPGTTYEFKVHASGSCAESNIENFTMPIGLCIDGNEPNDSKADATALPTNSHEPGLICPVNDEDWFRFGISSTAQADRNFKVTLNGYSFGPFEVYNSSNQLVSSTMNNVNPGFYYIKVTGPYSTNVAYDIHVETSSFNIPLRRTLESETDEIIEVTEKIATTKESIFVNKALDFNVYPNPSNGNFNLQLFKDREGDVIISIHDVSGRLVLKKTIYVNVPDLLVPLELDRLNGGNYFLTVGSDDGQKTERIILTR